MTNIILDTNIYLNFYRLDGEQSLEMLKNLNKLVKEGKYNLVLPQQIEDEFNRNKNSSSAIYGDHILNFQKGLEVEFKIPYLIKSSNRIGKIKKIIKRLKVLKEAAVQDYKNRVFNPRSRVNQQLKKLFINATRPAEAELILQRAQYRNMRGNPPRKDNSSFGDAIIWETILDQYINEDLILISGDGDFESEITKGKIHEFLSIEWSKRSSKKLVLYNKLGSFINENIKRKPIKKTTIDEEGHLNSIFATSANSMMFNSMDHQSLFVDGGVVANSPGMFMGGSTVIGNRCSCCGAPASSSTNGMYGLSRCENCLDSFSVGSICSKCGKHYHSSGLTLTGIHNDRCNDCQYKL